MTLCYKAQNSLEGSMGQKSLYDDIKKYVNYIAIIRCTHNELIDRHMDVRAGCTANMRQTHSSQGRRCSRSTVIAQTTCNSINRIAIQQRFLVEFSCKFPLVITTGGYHSDSLLRALLSVWSLVFVISSYYNKISNRKKKS